MRERVGCELGALCRAHMVSGEPCGPSTHSWEGRWVGRVRVRVRVRGGYVPTTVTKLVRCDQSCLKHECWYVTTSTTPPALAVTKARAQEFPITPPQQAECARECRTGSQWHTIGSHSVSVSVSWAPIAGQGLQLSSRSAESVDGRFRRFELLLRYVGTETVVPNILLMTNARRV
mgnify:CR=1 FL=1